MSSKEFNNMGKSIPAARRRAAYEWLRSPERGFDQHCAYNLVGAMAEQLERDKPFEAKMATFGKLDLTGTYRLIAILLTD